MPVTYYDQQPDRIRYRVALQRLAQRRHTRGDQIMRGVQYRIALAELVASTPGWSWRERAAAFGGSPIHLADMWRKQLRGEVRDADACDRVKEQRC